MQRLAKGFPLLALTGPRQSGKTTLARASFPDKPYVSLENPEERELAELDPRRFFFLARFVDGDMTALKPLPDGQLKSWTEIQKSGGFKKNGR